MKSIIKLLVCITVLITNIKKAESQVPDTTRYILDSIQPKFSYYIGKPLKVLLDDLKIQPIEYHGVFPVWNQPDTINFLRTVLEFYSLNDRINRRQWYSSGIKSPAIIIKFSQPIPIPKSWFMEGGIFEKRDWDIRKQRFFRNCIIGEIDLDGI